MDTIKRSDVDRFLAAAMLPQGDEDNIRKRMARSIISYGDLHTYTFPSDQIDEILGDSLLVAQFHHLQDQFKSKLCLV